MLEDVVARLDRMETLLLRLYTHDRDEESLGSEGFSEPQARTPTPDSDWVLAEVPVFSEADDRASGAPQPIGAPDSLSLEDGQRQSGTLSVVPPRPHGEAEGARRLFVAGERTAALAALLPVSTARASGFVERNRALLASLPDDVRAALREPHQALEDVRQALLRAKPPERQSVQSERVELDVAAESPVAALELARQREQSLLEFVALELLPALDGAVRGTARARPVLVGLAAVHPNQRLQFAEWHANCADLIAVLDHLLERLGIERLRVSPGDPARPGDHEVVGTSPEPELPEGRVVDVVRDGYVYVGEAPERIVVRPARVVVSRA
jgi:hypothetical protein